MTLIILAFCLAFACTICAAFWLALCKAAANADRRMEEFHDDKEGFKDGGELARWLKANGEIK